MEGRSDRVKERRRAWPVSRRLSFALFLCYFRIVETPEFLIWAIEYSCPVRGLQDGTDPERTERQLRAARAVSDAQHERRVFEGFGVQAPNGFRIADALAVYGSTEAVELACGECSANALAEIDGGALTGCYGIVPLPGAPAGMHEVVEQAIARACPHGEWTGLCA